MEFVMEFENGNIRKKMNFSLRNAHSRHRCIIVADQEQTIWKKRFKEEFVSNRHHQKFQKAWKPVQNQRNPALREKKFQSVLEQMIRRYRF